MRCRIRLLEKIRFILVIFSEMIGIQFINESADVFLRTAQGH